jgi:mannitol-1-phosphate 5-dehydrogenase
MCQKEIVIWGTGRIGRGFVADLFSAAGYRLVFVDQSQALVEQMRRAGAYSTVKAVSAATLERTRISAYRALSTDQEDEVAAAVAGTDLIALAVFPQNFKAAAAELARLILLRREQGRQHPVNIILCTNLVHAGPRFEALLHENLSVEDKEYFRHNVGVVEALVIRIAAQPPQEELEKDPLIVWTNGYPELPVDLHGFKGELPEVPGLRLVKDMRAEEARKIYTYNMAHAVLAYHGSFYGHKLLVESLDHPVVKAEALGALDEVSRALQAEYGFSGQEMQAWIDNVLTQTYNPVVADTVQRMAADPIRKLERYDRLTGAAFLCLKHNIFPQHLIRAIGAAFHFRDENDPSSVRMLATLQKDGLRSAVMQLCGVSAEDADFIDAVVQAYHLVPLEHRYEQMAQQAYDLGFGYEKQYHGCGQSVVAALTETLDMFDPQLFNAATGLCGGAGLVNQASCSAFTGSILVIGLLFHRRREKFDGDRQNKYQNFQLTQALHQKFVHKYGSVMCHEIHCKLYGRSYDLRNKQEGKDFEAAGAHENGCTGVVGDAARWTLESLAKLMLPETEV